MTQHYYYAVNINIRRTCYCSWQPAWAARCRYRMRVRIGSWAWKLRLDYWGPSMASTRLHDARLDAQRWLQVQQ